LERLAKLPGLSLPDIYEGGFLWVIKLRVREEDVVERVMVIGAGLVVFIVEGLWDTSDA